MPIFAKQSPTPTARGRQTSLAPTRYCSKLSSMRANAHLKPRGACGSSTPFWQTRGCLSTLSTSAKPPLFTYGNLVAARLHEEAGDTAAALAALRRRVIGLATYPHYVRYRREEGRLAASLGDTAGAIRAYRHYLALRSAPEPRLRAQADTVRIELAELLRAAGRH